MFWDEQRDIERIEGSPDQPQIFFGITFGDAAAIKPELDSCNFALVSVAEKASSGDSFFCPFIHTARVKATPPRTDIAD